MTPLRWTDGHLEMLDQRILPNKVEWISYDHAADVAEGIREMVVRGAPAIGIAAAYGMALAAKNGSDLSEADKVLRASRPTAVNLFWALDRINRLPNHDFETVLNEAKKIEQEDLAMNLAIGHNGAELIGKDWNIMTICNTGALATAGHGTALGVIRSAHQEGKNIHVWTCETRPRQQGLRLTTFELLHDSIPFHAISEGMAASLMRAGKVDCVIAGADRIAANGDTANKIGTFMLAILAHHHHIPFYIAAPSSTFDPSLANGDEIPIEERSSQELTHIEGVQVAPANTPTYNPGFDVTPAELITAIITEAGVFRPPYRFT
ncbi:MAG: S-methyl-5-thioribose-1-phosphate isomerase [Armatimonadetes bacterium]|nr:S-methyl-5-thioribose-1-phosphate isomerase [Armatimonadota bacterium]